MSRSLGELLAEVVRKYNLQGVLDASRVPGYWADVVGPRLASLTEIRSFEQGVLRVHVKDAVWRMELQLRREDLRTQLNARIGSDLVHEIVFR